MGKKNEILLLIDGIINLLLGFVLLLFPFGIAKFIGIPESKSSFYPTILGAVIFGIGLSLIIERYGYKSQIRGLGLAGAITINLCGSFILIVWLIIDPFNIPLRGYIILWSLALLVLVVGITEIIAKSWRY